MYYKLQNTKISHYIIITWVSDHYVQNQMNENGISIWEMHFDRIYQNSFRVYIILVLQACIKSVAIVEKKYY